MQLDRRELEYSRELLEQLQDALATVGDGLARHWPQFGLETDHDNLDRCFEFCFLLAQALKRIGGAADAPSREDCEALAERVAPIIAEWKSCLRSKIAREN